MFPSEQRGGDALKRFVLADAIHREAGIALVRLDYRIETGVLKLEALGVRGGRI